MMNFAIQPDGIFLFDASQPRTEYGSDVQRKNADGIPQWTVSVLHRGKDDARSELMNITVNQAKDPAEGIEPFSPVEFDELRIMSGENNGRTWVSLSSTGIHPRGAKAQATQQPAK